MKARTRRSNKPRIQDRGITGELSALAREVHRAADTFKPHEKAQKRLIDAANEIRRAWSQGWLGYQSRVYKAAFEPVRPGEFFDVSAGLSPGWTMTRGEWREYSSEQVIEIITRSAESPDIAKIEDTAQKIGVTFLKIKNSTVSMLAALNEPHLRDVQEAINALSSHNGAQEIANAIIPSEQRTSDRRALNEGIQIPPHLTVIAECMSRASFADAARELGRHIERAVVYLRTKDKIAAQSTTAQGRSKMSPLSTATLNILFLDLAGWSKLTPSQVTGYLENALPKLSDLIQGRHAATHLNSWGDAIVATFSSSTLAAQCALDIRDFFRRATERDGIPRGLVPRVSLHVGEVITAHNPLIDKEDIFGDAVHLAARLEPATPQGQVYATEAFAIALSSVAGLAPVPHEMGVVTLPKNYGTIKIFAVVGPNEDPPSRPAQEK